MIFLVWFWFSRGILAKRNKGIAIKEICTFRLAITDDQCCIVICGCGMNKRYVVWVTNWGKAINHIKRDWQLFFFYLYHLWYVYAFFTYVQVKYPLGFHLIMINILIFFKGCSIFIEWYIYIYIYIVFLELKQLWWKCWVDGFYFFSPCVFWVVSTE